MLTTERKFGFSTRQLHAGYDPEATTGSRAAPIYQTTAYDLQSTDRAARLFSVLSFACTGKAIALAQGNGPTFDTRSGRNTPALEARLPPCGERPACSIATRSVAAAPDSPNIAPR